MQRLNGFRRMLITPRVSHFVQVENGVAQAVAAASSRRAKCTEAGSLRTKNDNLGAMMATLKETFKLDSLSRV